MAQQLDQTLKGACATVQEVRLGKMDLNFIPHEWRRHDKKSDSSRGTFDLRLLAEVFVEILLEKPVDVWTKILQTTVNSKAETLGMSVSFPCFVFVRIQTTNFTDL